MHGGQPTNIFRLLTTVDSIDESTGRPITGQTTWAFARFSCTADTQHGSSGPVANDAWQTAALHKLVKDTHLTVFSYSATRLDHLYPWVDMRPDGKLKSIYSGEGFEVEEVIRSDLEIAALHESACLGL